MFLDVGLCSNVRRRWVEEGVREVRTVEVEVEVGNGEWRIGRRRTHHQVFPTLC